MCVLWFQLYTLQTVQHHCHHRVEILNKCISNAQNLWLYMCEAQSTIHETIHNLIMHSISHSITLTPPPCIHKLAIPPPPSGRKHSFHNPTFIQHKTMKTFLHSVGQNSTTTHSCKLHQKHIKKICSDNSQSWWQNITHLSRKIPTFDLSSKHIISFI